MDIDRFISSHSRQPITHQLLKSWLKDYKRPNDKIHALKSAGILKSVKKGFYIAGTQLHSGKPENALLANHLLGPSYISMETALSFYGIIPERVYEITSMTSKASRSFDTPVGLFSYAHLPYVTRSLIRSMSYAREYLTDNLRIDEETLGNLNGELISQWLQDAPKRDSLEMVIKIINSL